MKNSLSALPIFLFLLILSGCYVAPSPIYLLKPDLDNGFWLKGRYFMSEKSGDLESVLSYEQNTKRNYQFNLIIYNKSDSAVLVSPENFYYIADIYSTIIDQNQLLDNRHIIHSKDTVYARNPEESILEIKKRVSSENAKYESQKGNEGIISLLNLATDVSEIGKNKTAREEIQKNTRDIEQEMRKKSIQSSHTIKSNSLDQQLADLRYNSLRKTTLPPGYLVKGIIEFPIVDDVKDLEVHIIVGNENQVFKFQQILK